MTNIWETEPDSISYECNGFQCRILRHPTFKHLCGYVGLPPSHPLYNKSYNQISDMVSLYVHGGLTFSGLGDGVRCWDIGYWWIGFDCNHSSDFSPGLEKYPWYSENNYTHYRDINYVRNELENLSKQLNVVNLAIKKLIGGENNDW